MPKFTSVPELIEGYDKLFRPERAEGVEGIVQLNLTGDGGGTYHLIIKDQTLQTIEGTHDDPTVTVTADADDWIKVNNGDANPMMMMMTGKLKIGGSLPLATKFQGLFGK